MIMVIQAYYNRNYEFDEYSLNGTSFARVRVGNANFQIREECGVLIEVENLSKQYRVSEKQEGIVGSVRALFSPKYHRVDAVRGVTFGVEEGEALGFIGPNGAGKTTTLKILAGLLYPTNGKVLAAGFTPWHRKHDYLRQISLVMGQRSQLWWDIPAQDSFTLHRDIYEIPELVFRKRIAELTEMLDLSHLLKTPIRNLSLGERMKMEIVASLLHDPKILYLDEPTIGLDLISQKNIRQFLCHLNHTRRTTIILTSHYIQDIVSICPRVLVINHGQLVFDGGLDDMRGWVDDRKVIRANFAQHIDTSVLAQLGCQLTERSDTSVVLSVVRQDLPMVMAEISRLQPLDLAVTDQPLEEIIERVYREKVAL